jgi:D-glycero-beta-D-manno-heptose 1-phosphate adenylyltransferase
MKSAEKIKTLDELQKITDLARSGNRQVVFTNGCFDLLHVGHIRYLEEARSLGDMLIVGVNSDSSIKKIKGPLRPITSEGERIELVVSLSCVDYAVLFDTPDPLPLIEAIRPDILVKGADWPLEKIIGADLVMQGGGRVFRIPLTPHASTTMIIEKILARFGSGASADAAERSTCA